MGRSLSFGHAEDTRAIIGFLENVPHDRLLRVRSRVGHQESSLLMEGRNSCLESRKAGRLPSAPQPEAESPGQLCDGLEEGAENVGKGRHLPISRLLPASNTRSH
jgi:hypothetical protein